MRYTGMIYHADDNLLLNDALCTDEILYDYYEHAERWRFSLEGEPSIGPSLYREGSAFK